MDEDKILAAIPEAEVAKICRELIQIHNMNPPCDELPGIEYVASALRKNGEEILPRGY